jgi:transcriptional regulator with XRE-family HTH domain
MAPVDERIIDRILDHMRRQEWQQIVHTIGTSVRELRLLLGWSQQYLADQSVVSQGAISRMEAGRCGAVPFSSVVSVFRTLAAGATAAYVPVSPAAAHLFDFAQEITGAFALTEPDSDLVVIVHALQLVPYQRRPAFVQIIREIAAMLGHEDDTARSSHYTRKHHPVAAPDPDAAASEDDDDALEDNAAPSES